MSYLTINMFHEPRNHLAITYRLQSLNGPIQIHLLQSLTHLYVASNDSNQNASRSKTSITKSLTNFSLN